MDINETKKLLEAVTDAGLFEQLATAVLRVANPTYGCLVHPGVNAEGRTRKAPVDAIAVVPGTAPPHLITAHHTTCAQSDLGKKWLHDPLGSGSPKDSKSPEGDLLKASRIIQEERRRTSDARATLILTTNREPDQKLVRDVCAAGRQRGMEVDVWSRSRIAHILDLYPDGQYLRRKFLGIDQDRLSKELLRELSSKSLNQFPLPDPPDLWVERTLDRELGRRVASAGGGLFLISESGQGKSTASLKLLRQHLNAGGYGFVLRDADVATSGSLEEALELTLRRLNPKLEKGSGGVALGLCSDMEPLFLVVEDVNRAEQPGRLVERIAGWMSAPLRPAESQSHPSWRMICPIWPQILMQLADPVRKAIDRNALHAGALSSGEGRAAVERRASFAGKTLSGLQVEQIADALGNDPLLIALYDFETAADPGAVIGAYISGSLSRLVEAHSSAFTAADYRMALRSLAKAMLENRVISPTWADITTWFAPSDDTLSMLRHIVGNHEVLRPSGSSELEPLFFRHDRVRTSVLVEALVDLMCGERLADHVLKEPFYAEFIGAALSDVALPEVWAERVRAANPLALFYALCKFQKPAAPVHEATVAAIRAWLADPTSSATSSANLRWAIEIALGDTDSDLVLEFANHLGGTSIPLLEARFRNGDLGAGIALCGTFEPEIAYPRRDALVAHVLTKYCDSVTRSLEKILRDSEQPEDVLIGGLRLAGHIGSAELTDAIGACFAQASRTPATLTTFLWAASLCSREAPEKLLDPICEAWAALSDETEKDGYISERGQVAHGLVGAFARSLPEPALRFLIKRATQEDLRFAIWELLSRVDHPEAVEFIAGEAAERDRRSGGTSSVLIDIATSQWRADRRGSQMSGDSRNRLRALWSDKGKDGYLRKQAFRLWTKGSLQSDLSDLQEIASSDPLFQEALATRMSLGDRDAVPAFLSALRESKNRGYWWQFCRNCWSDELSIAFDQEFDRRRKEVDISWAQNEYNTDWITSELLIRLRDTTAEAILTKHWSHFRFSPYFVQSALYVATPTTRDLAAAALRETPDRPRMLQYVDHRFGIKTFGHPGVTEQRRIDSLIPYLADLAPRTVYAFWQLCNERGWFAWRRSNLDPRLTDRWRQLVPTESKLYSELDKIASELKMVGAEHRIEYWLDRFIERGDSPDQAMKVVHDWMMGRQTLDALQVAAIAVVYAGRRTALSLLKVDDLEPKNAVAAILANAQFALFRRTLA